MVHGESIVLQFGQAGIQAGHAFWVQLCAEHGIRADGLPLPPVSTKNISKINYNPNEYCGCTDFEESQCMNPHESYGPNEENTELKDSLYSHSSMGTYSPRTFCIDTDPGSLDWIKLSGYRNLYHPGQLISGKEDAGGCFARGYHHFGRHFTLYGREKIRKVLEHCDKFQGYMMFRSLTGGTGSGLSSIFMQKVNDDLVKNTVLSLDILPTFQGGLSLDPYNVVFALHHTAEVSNVSFLLANESLLRVCKRYMGVQRPFYQHANQLIATVASHITNGLRYRSDISLTLNELETNLVPLPRLKFPVLAYSPLCPPGRAVESAPMSTIVNNLFTREASLVPCDDRCGRYISAVLLLRGEFQPNDVNQHIHRLTHHGNSPVKFLDWLPPSMKYGLCLHPPIRPFGSDLGPVPRSAVAASNQTGMEVVLRPYINAFRKMYCRKAFVHLYTEEGMEELDFTEALESMYTLQEEFRMMDDSKRKIKKKCVEIGVSKDAVLAQRLKSGRCGPCRNLNVDIQPSIRVRECDRGCGPYPTSRWSCVPCLSRNGPIAKDMTIYGKSIGRVFRANCPDDTNSLPSNQPGIRKNGVSPIFLANGSAGCALSMGPFCSSLKNVKLDIY